VLQQRSLNSLLEFYVTVSIDWFPIDLLAGGIEQGWYILNRAPLLKMTFIFFKQ
jgi:hypothetical protein